MKKILLLLSEGFELFEASAFIDVFGWNNIYGTKDTKIVTCSKKRHVRSTFSIPIDVEQTIDRIIPDDYAALAIPGGFEIYGFYNDAYSNEFSRVIKSFDRLQKPIVSVCVGALAIAKSGVLAQRNATTYNIMNEKRQQQLVDFDANFIDTPLVIDKNIITSRSPETAINVAYELLKILTGEENCNYIKEIMGFSPKKEK